MRKPYSKRRKMWNRIIAGPILILVGGWLVFMTSFPGQYPGIIDIPILTSPIWLIGLGLGTAGLHMLALPLFKRGIF